MVDLNPHLDSLLFLGDVVLDRPYRVELSHPNLVFNLEGPLAKGPHPRRGTWNLCVEGCHLGDAFNPLPRAVSLANNHIMDFGVEALGDTRALLDGLGIQHFGVGTDTTAYGNPLVLTCGTKRIGILAYAASDIGAQLGEPGITGAAPLKMDVVAEDILRLKRERVDRIVVYPHWGVEHVSWPSPEVVSFAHQLIEMGTDLVVGTHAHCMQARERYAGKPIFYGLGNFIFPSRQLPGHYDDRGMPTRFGHTVLIDKQRCSLGVEYFPETGEVRERFFRFSGERVVEIPGKIEDIGMLTKNMDEYTALFNRRKARDILSYRLQSLAKNPRPSRIFRFMKEALLGR